MLKSTLKSVWDFLAYSGVMLYEFLPNLRSFNDERKELIELDKKIKERHGKKYKKAKLIGKIHGCVDSVMPTVMLGVKNLTENMGMIASTLGVTINGIGYMTIGVIGLIQLSTRVLGAYTSKWLKMISLDVGIDERQNLAQEYIISKHTDLNKFKEQSPKAVSSMNSYIDKNYQISREKIAMALNAVALACINLPASFCIFSVCFYNVISALYSIKHKKEFQQKAVSDNNRYGTFIDKMVDAASILRRTNNERYAFDRIYEMKMLARYSEEKNIDKNMELNLKNIPIFALTSTTVYASSIFSAIMAAGMTASATGSGLASAAAFAGAMMSADHCLSSAAKWLQLEVDKIEIYRTYKENMAGLEYEKQNVRSGERTLETSHGHLQVLNMSYLHESDRGVKDISLNFEKGPIYVIAGNSGSGKSTLMNLMLNEITPQSGEILLDGFPLHELTDETLLKQISVIEQKPVFLGETIREEMRLFNAAATDQDMKDVLEKVGLGYLSLDDVTEKDGCLSFSGGELQRLSIARALLRESSILLMDEPTSNLDANSKQAVWDIIEDLKNEKTILIVSHDTFEISNADYLIILENGQVTGEGSPLDLTNHPFLTKVQERAQKAVLENSYLLFQSNTYVPDGSYFSFSQNIVNQSVTSDLLSYALMDVIYQNRNQIRKKEVEKNHHMMQVKSAEVKR